MQVDRKYFEGLLQLEPAAAHIAECGASDFDLCFFGVKTCSGLIFFILVDIYDACHDQCFCLFPGSGKPSLYQQDIQPFLFFFHL